MSEFWNKIRRPWNKIRRPCLDVMEKTLKNIGSQNLFVSSGFRVREFLVGVKAYTRIILENNCSYIFFLN